MRKSILLSQIPSILNASGGLTVIDGTIYKRGIQDGFALVGLPGLAGIRGYLNNLDVGTTNSSGNRFVPSLLSYYGNKLSFSLTICR